MSEAKKDTKTVAVRENFYKILRLPLLTEKSTSASEQGKVIFKVALTTTKAEIKQAVEAIFGVRVTAVNTVTIKGKKKVFRGRLGGRSDYKKAIVSLAEGEKIDVMAGAR